MRLLKSRFSTSDFGVAIKITDKVIIFGLSLSLRLVGMVESKEKDASSILPDSRQGVFAANMMAALMMGQLTGQFPVPYALHWYRLIQLKRNICK